MPTSGDSVVISVEVLSEDRELKYKNQTEIFGLSPEAARELSIDFLQQNLAVLTERSD